MMKEGWICLHRQIREHWIWTDPEKFQWWIDILLSVNHEPRKVNIGNEIIDCQAGQSVMSLATWAARWKTNKSRVRRFFELLKNDSMIDTEGVGKSTRITVCNYAHYQGLRNDSETQVKRKRNDSETIVTPNNNDNNENNIVIGTNKRLSIALPVEKRRQHLIDQMTQYRERYGADMLNEFFSYWTELNTNGTKMRFEMERTWETKRRLERWNRHNTK